MDKKVKYLDRLFREQLKQDVAKRKESKEFYSDEEYWRFTKRGWEKCEFYYEIICCPYPDSLPNLSCHGIHG